MPGTVLFASLACASPPAHQSRRRRVAVLMVATGVLHGFGLALLCRSVALRAPLQPHADLLGVLIYDPPPAAALPLPKGSARSSEAVRALRSSDERREGLTEPVLAPEPDVRDEVEAEKEVAVDDPPGSEAGSDRGSPLGMDGGVDNGMIGGSADGMPGGVPNATGTSPVPDYDAPPRLVRQTRPRYPQEAFVNKVEGIVVVEILIDASGRVTRTRLIESIPLLDAAAREAVSEWVFQPAVKRGRPVPSVARAPVRFRIY